MKIRIIDDQGFPELTAAEGQVHNLMARLEPMEIIALYVMSEASEHGLFELLAEEAYKISGHEEDDGVEMA